MKLTLEHVLILILSVALIYYVYNHHDLLNDIVTLPDRDNPQIKKVKSKHAIKFNFSIGGTCYGICD